MINSNWFWIVASALTIGLVVLISFNWRFAKWMLYKRWWVILLVLVLATGLILLAKFTNHDEFDSTNIESWWRKWVEMPVVFGTFLFSFFIAITIYYNQWNSSLQKRFSVHAKYEDKFIMSCYDSYLTGDSDIRQWGQQILRQMAANQDLEFKLWLKSDKPQRKGNSNHYNVIFYLRTLPKQNTRKEVLYKTNAAELSTNDNNEILTEQIPKQIDFSKQHLVWFFDDDPGDSPAIKIMEYDTQPQEPLLKKKIEQDYLDKKTIENNKDVCI